MNSRNIHRLALLIAGLWILAWLIVFVRVALADPPPPELGVTIQPAAHCSEGCWRLVDIDYHSPEEWGAYITSL